MKNYTEKEKELDNVLEKLGSMTEIVQNINNDISKLSQQKNQLISEKKETEEKYKLLLKDHNSLKERLEKINREVKEKFSHKNQFNQKVDELNQETDSLLLEIEKWQM